MAAKRLFPWRFMDQGYRTAGLARLHRPNRQPDRAVRRWTGAFGLNPIRMHVV